MADSFSNSTISPSPARNACPHGHLNSGQGRFCLQCGSSMIDTPQGVSPTSNRASMISNDRFELLSPLTDHYAVDPQIFQWSLDAEAMSRLRSITPLVTTAKTISDSVGRRWVESTCNGIRLGKKQLPEIHHLAIHAARVLGMQRMPVVYLSGERPWETMTYGSEEQAFLVIGSALAASFRGNEMLFILAREMGRIVAGHTLWRTVIRFLVGELNPRAGLLRGGLTGLLDPGKWIGGAIELPLLGWARQAEITADRAGLLAIGNEDIARQTLMAWSLKAPNIPPRINVQAWIQQQEEDALDQGVQLSEMLSSSTPYIARRLKLLSGYAQDSQYRSHRQRWGSLLALPSNSNQRPEKTNSTPARERLKPTDLFTTCCPHCQTQLHVPRSLLKQDSIALRCANSDCRKTHVLKRKAPETFQESSKSHLQSKPSMLAAACD